MENCFSTWKYSTLNYTTLHYCYSTWKYFTLHYTTTVTLHESNPLYTFLHCTTVSLHDAILQQSFLGSDGLQREPSQSRKEGLLSLVSWITLSLVSRITLCFFSRITLPFFSRITLSLVSRNALSLFSMITLLFSLGLLSLLSLGLLYLFSLGLLSLFSLGLLSLLSLGLLYVFPPCTVPPLVDSVLCHLVTTGEHPTQITTAQSSVNYQLYHHNWPQQAFKLLTRLTTGRWRDRGLVNLPNETLVLPLRGACLLFWELLNWPPS